MSHLRATPEPPREPPQKPRLTSNEPPEPPICRTFPMCVRSFQLSGGNELSTSATAIGGKVFRQRVARVAHLRKYSYTERNEAP